MPQAQSPQQTQSPVKPLKSARPLKQYTRGEEIFNAVTHGVGALLAVVGGTVAVTLAVLFGDTREVVACSIYAVALFLLYTMSTLYHAFPFPKAKFVFRVFDHSTVFILIAGTYTPFMLVTLRGNWKGITIFWVVWAAAVIGIVLNALSVNKFAKFSLVLYVVMGWSIIFAIGDVVGALPTAALVLHMAGGVCYTGGIAFYVAKGHRFTHSVWHLFVLAGSVLHYLCITMYVLPLGMLTA